MRDTSAIARFCNRGKMRLKSSITKNWRHSTTLRRREPPTQWSSKLKRIRKTCSWTIRSRKMRKNTRKVTGRTRIGSRSSGDECGLKPYSRIRLRQKTIQSSLLHRNRKRWKWLRRRQDKNSSWSRKSREGSKRKMRRKECIGRLWMTRLRWWRWIRWTLERWRIRRRNWTKLTSDTTKRKSSTQFRLWFQGLTTAIQSGQMLSNEVQFEWCSMQTTWGWGRTITKDPSSFLLKPKMHQKERATLTTSSSQTLFPTRLRIESQFQEDR